MGLPLFITPVEPEVASKAAEKVASGPRSSIRRQRTLRGPHVRLSAEARMRRLRGLVAPPETNQDDYELSEVRIGSRPTQNEDLQTRAFRMFEREQMRLRDTLSFEREHLPSAEMDGPMMPPVPESRDFATTVERQREIQRLQQVRRDLRRMARRRPAPTPPYTDTDLAFMAPAGIDSPRPSSLTPALSPVRQAPSGDMEAPTRQPLDDTDFSFGPRRSAFTADLGGSTISERMHALSRAAIDMDRPRRRLRQAQLDGLGDRDRSPSPPGADSWDTLLTGITPDPQPPSANSSFASTSAAAAAASSSSGSGSGPASGSTSMTSLEPTPHDCDSSDLGSNTEDDDDEETYELIDLVRSRRGDRFWRSYADVTDARASRGARRGSIEEMDGLGGTQRIISRLAGREDIPDEWWASAGLSRILRREPTS